MQPGPENEFSEVVCTPPGGQVLMMQRTSETHNPEDLISKPDLPALIPYQTDPSNYPVPSAYQPIFSDQSKKVVPIPSARTTAIPDPTPWGQLLTPDNSPRAAPFQRGYTRSAIGKHFPGTHAPRLDYTTIGQCEAILEHFNHPVAALHKSGRNSMASWRTLVILTFFIGAVTSPMILGQLILLVMAIATIHHFWTRRKLPPPFST